MCARTHRISALASIGPELISLLLGAAPLSPITTLDCTSCTSEIHICALLCALRRRCRFEWRSAMRCGRAQRRRGTIRAAVVPSGLFGCHEPAPWVVGGAAGLNRGARATGSRERAPPGSHPGIFKPQKYHFCPSSRTEMDWQKPNHISVLSNNSEPVPWP